MLHMDRDWVDKQLTDFRDLCDQYQREHNRNLNEYTPKMQELAREMTAATPRVRRILEELAPELVEEIREPLYIGGAGDSLRATMQALTILHEEQEWEAKLAPDSPRLSAEHLHPQVWGAARPLWDTGQYRVAVEQAATSLSVHLGTRVDTHLRERELVASIFSPLEPKDGQPRLHVEGDRQSKSWKSAQEGLHLLAQGAFAGLRNPAAHTSDQWTEHEALEALAVLSIVARWAEGTKLVRWEDEG